MSFRNSKSSIYPDEFELENSPTADGDNGTKVKCKIDHGKALPDPSCWKGKRLIERTRNSFKAKVLSRVFSEEFDRVKKKNILDPQGPTNRRWNKIFLAACLVSVFVDPLFLFSPVVHNDDLCIDIAMTLQVVLTVIRSAADIFYTIHIFVRFRTAYVAPSSRVFGRGELVIDPSKIAKRYLCKGFWIDVFAALPLPQVLLWVVIPNISSWAVTNTDNALRLIIILQFIPRFLLIFPLSSEIVTATGFETEKAWAGAAYNLMFFLLVSHVLGACWFLFTIERQEACWIDACRQENSCQYSYFDCRKVEDSDRTAWFQSSNITNTCDPNNNNSQFAFGIYGEGVPHVTSALFMNKYFYALWWGLKNMSTLGQNLATSTAVGEIIFSIIVSTLGLLLLALLIGNMQRYLQSTTLRLEQWRIKRTDAEQWMRHRQLPQELRQSVRKYDQYKWIATRGVDEEAILEGLPLELRRDIKRHLCYDLLRRVPLFEQMDETTLDAICARLKPSLCTQGSSLVREGDPVSEMIFIIRGNLDSYTTNGRTDFFNSCRIGPGDFCGEELLTWAVDTHPSIILPSSTRTVTAISDVEAFALRAEDLKFLAAQFRIFLHSKKLRHKFRFYSPQWRTWAACFIQIAWRRYKRRKSAAELCASDSLMTETATPGRLPVIDIPPPGSGLADYAASILANIRGNRNYPGSDSSSSSSLKKPAEPDFSCR